MDSLSPWNENSNDEIRHFSGTATYMKRFQLKKQTDSLALDLGDVGVLARVTLNGHDLGTLWKAPFRVDITDAVRPGENRLEVEVTNLWVNRLIGDERFGRFDKTAAWLSAGDPTPKDALRETVVVHSHYKKNDDLQPSGLIGPVKVLHETFHELNEDLIPDR